MTRDQKALAMIKAYQGKYGIAPSGVELAKHLKVSKSSAYGLLKRMEQEGLIERPRHMGGSKWPTHRSIRLTSAAMKAIEEPM